MSEGGDTTAVNRGWHSRGYLPHFEAAEILQTVTFRLADAMPAEKLREWEAELKLGENAGGSAGQKRRDDLRKKIEKWIDAGHGACHLRDPRIATLVQNALLHFDGARYKLLEWAIMPNHVHVLLETSRTAALASIVNSWKSFSARRANAILKRKGAFWELDYFDRFIRNENHFFFAVRYIRENPVNAGLCKEPEDWFFGGAWYRVHGADGAKGG